MIKLITRTCEISDMSDDLAVNNTYVSSLSLKRLLLLCMRIVLEDNARKWMTSHFFPIYGRSTEFRRNSSNSSIIWVGMPGHEIALFEIFFVNRLKLKVNGCKVMIQSEDFFREMKIILQTKSL